LPACDAQMEHVPVAIIAAVVPETVQTLVVVEVKLTCKPELAVADRVTVAFTDWLGMAAKLTVWLTWCTRKVCDAVAAA
jgi:hypothetical protein